MKTKEEAVRWEIKWFIERNGKEEKKKIRHFNARQKIQKEKKRNI